MRILFVIPGSPYGSSMIFAKRQASSLRDAGIHVDVLYLPLWKTIGKLAGECRKLRKGVHKCKPDLIHAQYGTQTAFVCAYSSVSKLVITFRGSDLNPSPGTNGLRIGLGHFFSQVSALRADRIVCVSRQLRERLWWGREKAEIIPSPVDLNLFRPIPQEIARASLDWKEAERIALFNAGKDPVGKNLSLAQEAIQKAEDLVGPVRLVVLRGEIPPDQMPAFLNAADCLLLTSQWEGSPNVVKEAMACNLPVVSTRVGDVEERLQGVFPSRVTERDPQQLGKALIGILALKKRSNGREKISDLSEERLTQRLIGLYESVLGKCAPDLDRANPPHQGDR